VTTRIANDNHVLEVSSRRHPPVYLALCDQTFRTSHMASHMTSGAPVSALSGGTEPVPAARPGWAAWPGGPACGSGCGSARRSAARTPTGK